MSWYVEYLLRNREEIRCKQDIESDEFNDLLLVEKEISSLLKRSLITKPEIQVLSSYLEGHNVEDLELNKRSIILVIRSVTKRISMCLGGIFTDEGYIDYIKNKYKLDNEQVKVIANYIRSYHKYESLSKTHKEKNNA